MKNKAFAVIVCLVLVAAMAIPGTLALSTDTDSSQTNATAEVPATPETPSETPAETLAPSEQPTEGTSEQPKQSTEEETPAPSETPKECTCDPKPAEGEAHKEGCPLYVAPEQPAEAEKTCTCDPKPAEGEAHKEGCPLYVAPEQPAEAEKTCTCDPKPAEGEAHKEGCPLYVAPEKPADPSHIDTCSDDCTDADCKCPCHLFDKIMACTTQEALEDLIAETPEEYFGLLSDEQIQKVEAHIKSLETVPLPAVTIENDVAEETVPSEIVRPTVNYTYVAPFGDPVTGGNN